MTPIPWPTMNAAIEMRGTRAASKAMKARTWTRRAFIRRFGLVGRSIRTWSACTAGSPLEPAADGQPTAVHDHGDHEEDDPKADQRLGGEALRRLVEFVRDHARQREARGKDRSADLRGIADHEGHGD